MAPVLRDQVYVIAGVDWMMVSQFDHFLKGVVDEDEADESRKAFLSKASEILHQETGVCGDQDQTQKTRPQTNPQPELQIVEIIIPEPIKEAHSIVKPTNNHNTGGQSPTNERTGIK